MSLLSNSIASAQNQNTQLVQGVASSAGYINQIANPSGTPTFLTSLYAQCGVPMLLQSSGTVGNNGALTLTSATDITYSNCYMTFPQGALFTNSPAGQYFTQMSSHTVGVVYNNQYISGIPTIPTAAQLVPIVATGPGAYIQPTGVLNSLVNFTFPGNVVGNNGAIRTLDTWAFINNTNSRGMSSAIGANNITGPTVTTALSSQQVQHVLRNRGLPTLQVNFGSGGTGIATSGSPVGLIAIDTTQPQTVSYNAILNTASTDWVVLEGFSFEILPG